jgi:hypothetical protein
MGRIRKESEKFATSVAKHITTVFCVLCFCFCFWVVWFFPPSFGIVGEKKKNTKKQKHTTKA